MLESIISLVQQVGHFQMQHFRQMSAQSTTEKSPKELVSFVDVESEKQLISGLQQLTPNFGFYGEESGKSGNSDHYWIIDPLDGTTNYLSGLAQFSISVACVENGLITYGVVYQPATGDLFYAKRGHGFYHNGKRISPSQLPQSLAEALVGTGFPYRSPDCTEPFLNTVRGMLQASRGIRRMGSAALDLCYLGANYLQAFWETDLQPYDVAAALLFLEEQHYPVLNEHGTQYQIGCDRLLISAPPSIVTPFKNMVLANYQF